MKKKASKAAPEKPLSPLERTLPPELIRPEAKPDPKPVRLEEIPPILESEISLQAPLDEEPEITTSAHVPAYDVTAKQAEGIAKRAVDLIAKGEDVVTAVTAAGGSDDMLKNPVLQAALKRLRGQRAFSAEVQRAALRHGDFTTWLALYETGHRDLERDGETGTLKLALDYSKTLRGDPDIGLQAPPLTQINIDMKPLEGVLSKVGEETPEAAFDWQDETND